jgi:hypothetical protein
MYVFSVGEGARLMVSPFFASVAMCGFILAIFHSRPGFRWGGVIGGILAIAISFQAFAQGREQFIVTQVLARHGYNIDKPDDKTRYLDDVATGKLKAWTLGEEISASLRSDSVDQGALLVFKGRRFARMLFWPPAYVLVGQNVGR